MFAGLSFTSKRHTMSRIRTHVNIDDVIKDLEKIPFYIVVKFQRWVKAVECQGLEETMKIPGFHDEALRGERKGQRSIRLNRSYRAIYIRTNEDEIVIVKVLKVSKHEY